MRIKISFQITRPNSNVVLVSDTSMYCAPNVGTITTGSNGLIIFDGETFRIANCECITTKSGYQVTYFNQETIDRANSETTDETNGMSENLRSIMYSQVEIALKRLYDLTVRESKVEKK